MRRPWQIWLVFLSGLAVAFAAMGWLSFKALGLEQEREQSRVEAELEEEVRSALGNVDYALVMPILSQESAWPHFAYHPYYASSKGENKSTGKSSAGKPTTAAASDPIPSPLLVPTNDCVLLNFEIDPDGTFVSPQCPPANMTAWAAKNGSSTELINDANERLNELKLVCSRDQLLERLPHEQPFDVALPIQFNSNWQFGGANTYTGNTTVNGGVINANGANMPFANQPADIQANPPKPIDSQPNSSQVNVTSGGTLTINSSASAGGRAGQRNTGGLTLANSGPPPQAAYGQGGTNVSVQPNAPPISPQRQGYPNQSDNAAQTIGSDANLDGEVYGGQQGVGSYANPQAGTLQGNGRQDANRDQQLKNSLDLASRGRGFSYSQGFAQQQQARLIDNEKAAQIVAGTTNVRQGLGKALWLKDSLIFARRVAVDGKTLIQGCVLDWPKLHDWLTSEVQLTLPYAEFVPVTSPADETRGRMLATLPVKLTVPAALYVPATWYTPIRISLLIAWSCALLGAAAVAALLFGVVTLSERRGAFVSAVTHELRTPLTTFRMYAEMLSEGMVHEPEQQKHYLGTLRAEADRLTHLVGNVLAYARLERGKLSDRLKEVPVAELIDRCRERLAERAKQAGFEFVSDIDDPTLARTVRADSAAVEQILFNLVDNAGKYAATATDRRIHLEAEQAGRYVLLRVRDHGCGVCAKEAKRLFQPFRKSAKDAANSAPGVGLGLALSRRLARDLGGELTSEDRNGDGACFVLKLVATS